MVLNVFNPSVLCKANWAWLVVKPHVKKESPRGSPGGKGKLPSPGGGAAANCACAAATACAATIACCSPGAGLAGGFAGGFGGLLAGTLPPPPVPPPELMVVCRCSCLCRVPRASPRSRAVPYAVCLLYMPLPLYKMIWREYKAPPVDNNVKGREYKAPPVDMPDAFCNISGECQVDKWIQNGTKDR